MERRVRAAPMTLLNQERWDDGTVTNIRKVWEGGI